MSIRNSRATLFSSVAAVTVVNTVAETSILPTGSAASEVLIAANTLFTGSNIRITGYGVYTAPLALVSTATFRLKFGGVTLQSLPTTSLLAGANNAPFRFEFWINIRSIGMSGTGAASGNVSYSASAGQAFDAFCNSVTLNTTVDNVIGLTLQWNIALTTRSATVQMLTAELF